MSKLDYKAIIDKLIKIRKSNASVIAACVYGSRVQKREREDSDLDVYLITDGNENLRGMYKIDGIYVDYFEKSFITIMNEIERNHKIGNSFYASFVRNSEVVFDYNNIVPRLVNYQLQIENLKPHSYGLTEEDYSNLSYWYNMFKSSKEQNEEIFNYYYYVLLEQLRQKYHKANNYSQIYAKDVPSLYQDEEKSAIYGLNLPDKDYKEYFLESLLEERNKDKKEEQIEVAASFLEEDLSKVPKEVPKGLKKQALKTYLISFSHESKKLFSKKNDPSFPYLYYNLLENIKRLNNLYQEDVGAKLSDDYINLMITSLNPQLIDLAMQNFCKKSEISPTKYEISYTKKKYNRF